MYNFHPYQGPNQAGAPEKNADGFEKHVKSILSNTKKPVIATEFGQFCCSTDGSCYNYNGSWGGKKFGYNEAIINIAQTYHASWMPWAWRPVDKGSKYTDHSCEDINADGKTGQSLATPSGGKGADWQRLWSVYANQSPGEQSLLEDDSEFILALMATA